MSLIIGGKPLGYRIIIEGEVAGPGITEAHVEALIQQGVSFNARLASCNRAMHVTVGELKPLDAPGIPRR